MNNEFFNQFNDSSKASFETLQRFQFINAETLEKLAALQLSLTSLNVESTVQQARLLTTASTPDALLEAESALARDYSDKLIQITNETTAIISDSREQLVAFAEKTFQAATPAVKTAAKPAATKPAQAKKKVAKKAVKKAA